VRDWIYLLPQKRREGVDKILNLEILNTDDEKKYIKKNQVSEEQSRYSNALS
jgi:hypothetical protein